MLAEIANALHVEQSKVKSWWPVRRKDGKPRSLVVRLENKTICAGPRANKELWERCQPMLDALERKKATSNKKRVSHRDIEVTI